MSVETGNRTRLFRVIKLITYSAVFLARVCAFATARPIHAVHHLRCSCGDVLVNEARDFSRCTCAVYCL